MLLRGSDLRAVPFTRGAILLLEGAGCAAGAAPGDAAAATAWQWAHGSSRLASTAFNFNAGPSFIWSMPVR